MQAGNVVNSVLLGVGLLLLLAAAFDITPHMDNVLVFLGIACFIIAGVARRIMK
ncbi:MAG: hypothetical protein ISS92_03680 [Candidatus Omnitrophica bacterium]|nr:hypothetical protein [Candidatus Omnitrophota bacterium]